MTINTTPKRSRALPRQWKRFLYLEPGDGFFIGRCRYVKVAFFYAVADLSGRRIYLPPWRKVQTDVLVRDARPGGKSSLPNASAIQYPTPDPMDLPRVEQPSSGNITGPTS